MKVVGYIGQNGLGRVSGEVAHLERLGYDVLTTPELAYEATMRWTLAANASTSAEVSTSVMIAFARSPFVTAQMAWELQKLTGGRISIGLGTQVKGHNERRFSTGPWVPPAPRMEEYVRVMRAAWQTFQTGELVAFEGKHYNFSLCPPAFNPGPIDFPAPKVFIAAVGAAMTRVAGRVADGLLPHSFTTPEYVNAVTLPNLARGAGQAGRDVSEIEIAAGGMMALAGSEGELEQQLLALRERIAFYGSTRTYASVFATHGLEDLGQKLHELSVTNRWAEMPDAISLDVARLFVTAGTWNSLPGEIERRLGYAGRVSIPDIAKTPGDEERLAELVRRVQAI